MSRMLRSSRGVHSNENSHLSTMLSLDVSVQPLPPTPLLHPPNPFLPPAHGNKPPLCPTFCFLCQALPCFYCSARQGLKALLTTLIISLPAFYNVGALLMLVFFMYSYVAVLLFGSIQPQAAINDHANFSHFGKQARVTPLRYNRLSCWCMSCYARQDFQGGQCISVLAAEA